MKTILITGHEGLIGRHVWPELRNFGYNVRGIDLKAEELMFRGDIRDQNLLKKAIKGCSGIIQFAAVSRVIDGERKRNLCWETNAEASRSLLDIAFQSPLKPWVIMASSREVYGEAESFPVKETDPLKPVNIYGRSKCAMEEATNEARKKGLQTAIVRLANVYGCTKDHSDRVLPAFCRAAILGNILRVDGKENTFDFTHIYDVRDGIVRIVKLLEKGVEDLPALHLLPGIPVTLEQAAEVALKVAKTSASIIEAPSRDFDVKKFIGCPKKAEEVLGWKAKIAPETGIKLFVEEFRNQFLESRKAI